MHRNWSKFASKELFIIVLCDTMYLAARKVANHLRNKHSPKKLCGNVGWI